ncbi:GNAT family N-acetyltransferase (plasmid) [Agrobacterium tumefaciens]|nr:MULTISPECIES: GNAT family N-acetyltransferase [Rhizobium/Agrobacterium group]WCA62651.1 GNAT family N-acetyltransferase [Agrobacterium tumefaciens]
MNWRAFLSSCLIRKRSSEHTSIICMSTPAYQGKGVARSLLAAGIQRFSPQQRNGPVHLLTLADNHPARRFYEKLNVQIIEENRSVMASYPDLIFVRYQWRNAHELAATNFNPVRDS